MAQPGINPDSPEHDPCLLEESMVEVLAPLVFWSTAALFRVVAALERAEEEYPKLAAPDGTVAVQIEDLRAILEQMDAMRDTLALGQMVWRERWYGSEPLRGSSIVTERGAHVAYFGGNEETHREVRKVVAAHNAALAERAQS